MKQKTNPATVRRHIVTCKSSISLSLSVLGANLDPKHPETAFFVAYTHQPADTHLTSRCQQTPACGGWTCGQFRPKRPLKVAPQRQTPPCRRNFGEHSLVVYYLHAIRASVWRYAQSSRKDVLSTKSYNLTVRMINGELILWIKRIKLVICFNPSEAPIPIP